VAKLYDELSGDIHAAPWRTDVWRSIEEQSNLMWQTPTIMSKDFRGYLQDLVEVLDFGGLILLNIFKDDIKRNDLTRRNLNTELDYLKQNRVPLTRTAKKLALLIV